MTIRDDAWDTTASHPDRLHYATGVLLDAADFSAEQMYHRSRLAIGLAHLFGSGTVAGLKVEWEAALAAGDDAEFPDGREERLLVRAGLAVDRVGRIIEIPSDYCLRLGEWYTSRNVEQLKRGFHTTPTAGVIADLFVRFAVCSSGHTPALAEGPFDALDAVQPARLRDSHQLELIIREESDPPLPLDRWRALEVDATPTRLKDEILSSDSWADMQRDGEGRLRPLIEHTAGQDVMDLFLARITIPADNEGGAGQRPPRTANADVIVDNHSRRFVYPPAALARRDGL